MMRDPDQEDTLPSGYDYGLEDRRGTSGWLLVLIVIAVLLLACCICLFLAIAGVAILSPAMEGTFSMIIENT